MPGLLVVLLCNWVEEEKKKRWGRLCDGPKRMKDGQQTGEWGRPLCRPLWSSSSSSSALSVPSPCPASARASQRRPTRWIRGWPLTAASSCGRWPGRATRRPSTGSAPIRARALPNRPYRPVRPTATAACPATTTTRRPSSRPSPAAVALCAFLTYNNSRWSSSLAKMKKKKKNKIRRPPSASAAIRTEPSGSTPCASTTCSTATTTVCGTCWATRCARASPSAGSSATLTSRPSSSWTTWPPILCANLRISSGATTAARHSPASHPVTSARSFFLFFVPNQNSSHYWLNTSVQQQLRWHVVVSWPDTCPIDLLQENERGEKSADPLLYSTLCYYILPMPKKARIGWGKPKWRGCCAGRIFFCVCLIAGVSTAPPPTKILFSFFFFLALDCRQAPVPKATWSRRAPSFSFFYPSSAGVKGFFLSFS